MTTPHSIEQQIQEARERTPNCNCASFGLPESFRHGLGCPYGKEAAARETEVLRREAWGHKLTVHIYMAGESSGEVTRRLIDAVNAAVPDAEFVGMSHQPVQTKPQDSGGS